MTKKFLGLIMSGILLVGSSVSALAAEQKYSSYTLYSRYQNNYTSYHAKQTDDDYMTNRITALSGTTSATFWACDNNSGDDIDSHRQISRTYSDSTSDIDEDAYDLNFKSNYDKSEGDKVALGMEDGVSHSSSVGSVSGYVDFR